MSSSETTSQPCQFSTELGKTAITDKDRRMCIERTDQFSKYPVLDKSAEYRLLWLYICFRANEKGLFWRSYQTIATETGLTRRSAYRLMQQMQDDELLKKTGETKYKTNLFFVTKPPVDNLADRDTPVPRVGTHLSLSIGTHLSPKRKIKTLKEKNTPVDNSKTPENQTPGIETFLAQYKQRSA